MQDLKRFATHFAVCTVCLMVVSGHTLKSYNLGLFATEQQCFSTSTCGYVDRAKPAGLRPVGTGLARWCTGVSPKQLSAARYSWNWRTGNSSWPGLNPRKCWRIARRPSVGTGQSHTWLVITVLWSLNSGLPGTRHIGKEREKNWR